MVGLGPLKVLSIPDAIGIAIEKWMQEKQGIQQDLLGEAGASSQPAMRDVVTGVADGGEWRLAIQGHEREQEFLGACPDCGSQLAFAEGCAKCHVCGYSECG